MLLVEVKIAIFTSYNWLAVSTNADYIQSVIQLFLSLVLLFYKEKSMHLSKKTWTKMFIVASSIIIK